MVISPYSTEVEVDLLRLCLQAGEWVGMYVILPSALLLLCARAVRNRATRGHVRESS